MKIDKKNTEAVKHLVSETALFAVLDKFLSVDGWHEENPGFHEELDCDFDIKSIFSILGTDGILRYALYRLSKDYKGLPKWEEF